MDLEFLYCFAFLAAMLFCGICFIACCVYGAVAGALVFAFILGCGVIFLWMDGAFY